jgi:hypothetical protein
VLGDLGSQRQRIVDVQDGVVLHGEQKAKLIWGRGGACVEERGRGAGEERGSLIR